MVLLFLSAKLDRLIQIYACQQPNGKAMRVRVGAKAIAPNWLVAIEFRCHRRPQETSNRQGLTRAGCPLKLDHQFAPPAPISPERLRMHCFRSMHTVLRAGGRLTVALGLVGFIVANTGLPSSAPSPRAGRTRVGHFSARIVRAVACPLTNVCAAVAASRPERLAWAKANHIDAPAELLAQVADELAALLVHDDDHDGGELAEHEHAGSNKHGASCCSHAAADTVETTACAKCDHADAAEQEACHHDDGGDEHINSENGDDQRNWRLLTAGKSLSSSAR